MSEDINYLTDNTDELSGRFLTFDLEEVCYGLPLRSVIEIISIQNITHVPMLPPYISGIINLRGKIVPVVDIRIKLGMDIREYDTNTCIIVVNIGVLQIGLVVDKVNAVVPADLADMVNPPDSSSDMADQHIDSIIQKENSVVLVISLEKLFFEDLLMLDYA